MLFLVMQGRNETMKMRLPGKKAKEEHSLLTPLALAMNLEELPQKIKDHETQIYMLENQLFDFAEKIKEYEVPERIKILDELDERGKFKYGNDRRREDELYMRLKTDEGYTYCKNQIKNILSERDMIKIELEFYKNIIRIKTISST